MNLLSPSILSSDFTRLSENIKLLEKGGADTIHLDIMDGNFVPNITFGPKMIKDLRKLTDLTFDAHLMIMNPENYLEQFADAGCDYITIHPESTIHLQRHLKTIRQLGKKAGVVLNPSTPLEYLDYIIDDIDLLLLMSVNPGFGGQSFIESIYKKIERARELIGDRDIILQVDGGIKDKNINKVKESGANAFVVGSGIFNSEDIYETTKYYKGLIK
ncbi:MAG: ribulose-phosphate 3-epimerase [Tissierellia bacterium]|nr:ribulose-phosphate 3-epimerase [Tissierellia bacterium]